MSVPVWMSMDMPPEGFLELSKSLLPQGPAYLAFRAGNTNAAESIVIGDYIVINATDPVVEGDRIAYVESFRRFGLGRLLKSDDGVWCLAPFKGSRRPPMFVDNLDLVIGKVERIFRVPERPTP
jgi:hypothetical protein